MRQAGHRGRGHRRRGRADLHEQVPDALAVEGQRAGHALVGDDAERPEMGSVIDVSQPTCLLGGHVIGGAQHGAGLGAAGHAAAPGGRFELGDAEVEHLGDLFVVVGPAHEKDVLWLEIPVNDPGVVRALQGPADLDENSCCLAERQSPDAVESTVERLADEQLHDDVGTAVSRDAVIVNLDRVPTLDRGGGARLGDEPGARFLTVGVLGIDKLDRDACPQARVATFVHRTHAASSDEAHHLVFSGDEAARGVSRIVHGLGSTLH